MRKCELILRWNKFVNLTSVDIFVMTCHFDIVAQIPEWGYINVCLLPRKRQLFGLLRDYLSPFLLGRVDSEALLEMLSELHLSNQQEFYGPTQNISGFVKVGRGNAQGNSLGEGPTPSESRT